jgi:hypothetical protein
LIYGMDTGEEIWYINLSWEIILFE